MTTGPTRLVSYLQSLPEGVIPSTAELKARVDDCLLLSNPDYPREAVVDKVTALVDKWLRKYGRDSAINLIDLFLIKQKQLIVRRLENGNVDSTGNGRSTHQFSDLSDASAVVGGTEGRPISSGPQNFRLVEGGISEGDSSGSGAAEQSAGDVHHPDSTEGISKSLVQLELSEHEEDLRVFQKAYSGIRARVRTVEDEGRLMKLVTWSGTTATMGILELVIHNMERVIAELKGIIAKIEAGEIPDLDKE